MKEIFESFRLRRYRSEDTGSNKPRASCTYLPGRVNSAIPENRAHKLARGLDPFGMACESRTGVSTIWNVKDPATGLPVASRAVKQIIVGRDSGESRRKGGVSARLRLTGRLAPVMPEASN